MGRTRPHDDADAFAAFFEAHEPVVRRLLVAGLGPEVGRDAAAEAFAWAWSTSVSTLARPWING